ncbi:MAG TPA: RluA family pseudouridine synthase, partial [Gaiellaceae bacterium]|nr:RluA family pseudouridine synthase [Gaiellaceae bacterium]
MEVDVPPAAAGERLDRFVAGLEPVGSRAAAGRLVAAGKVLVNGRPRPKAYRLAGGERLAVALPESEALEPASIDLRVAFEDEHLLVVDKPAGVVVHPAPGHESGTLVQALLGRAAGGAGTARPGIVHRLDRDTSGLLVVAKTEAAFRGLQRLVRRRALEREYLALVRGEPRSRRGRIEAAIGRDRYAPIRQSLETGRPREAVTHFEVAEALPPYALLRVTLETGRTHQIRVHLAAIDLPVAGDAVYGVPGLGLERQFLHAASLAFPHPVTGARIETES